MKKNEEQIIKLAKEIKNKKAKEWREKNKDKVKAINQRYWINKAKKQLEEENKNNE